MQTLNLNSAINETDGCCVTHLQYSMEAMKKLSMDANVVLQGPC